MKASDVLRLACSYLGQGEEPRGSNWGPPDGVVVRSLACVGIKEPKPWCAAFVCLVLCEAGLPRDVFGCFSLSPSGIRLRNHNATFIVPSDRARPGDIYVIDHGKGLSHVGFVATEPGKMWADGATPAPLMFFDVSGNTNSDGSRAGYKVASNLRNLDDPRMTILRPPYEDET